VEVTEGEALEAQAATARKHRSIIQISISAPDSARYGRYKFCRDVKIATDLGESVMWDEVRRKGKEGSLSDVTGRIGNKGTKQIVEICFYLSPAF
jgi:hypothetical protein